MAKLQGGLKATSVERKSGAEVASRMRRLRSRLGLSQPQLAALLGVSAASINRWEHAEARPSALAWRLIERAEIEGFVTADPSDPDVATPNELAEGGTVAPPAVTTNLPIPISSFVGRERELSELRILLATTRLLTLTGVGGCGKTRLALELAREVARDFPHPHPNPLPLGEGKGSYPTQASGLSPESFAGVWLIELAALADPRRVPEAIAAALGIPEQPNRPPLEILTERLNVKRVLMVLDNCEHLRDACAQVAGALLGACGGLTLVVTSRAPLGLAGEAIWRVPPLSLPTIGDRADLSPGPFPKREGETRTDGERMERDAARRSVLSPQFSVLAESSSEAVRLLVERVRAVRSEFTLDEHNSAAVAEICRRVDGLPLAIELVAAQASTLTIQQIAARIADRFRLLTGDSSTRLPRQRTLHATLNWSYDLLSADEQRLFRQLSVFAGGFSLEAAEAVGNPQPSSEPLVLDLLRGLVEKSLVDVDMTRSEARYRLLETVREYALARLGASGEAPEAQRRQGEFFLELAVQGLIELRGPRQAPWFERLAVNLDNVRAALRWFVSQGEVEAGLCLASALARFWEVRGIDEGREWFTRLLALPTTSVRPSVRAWALNSAGWMALGPRDLNAARRLAEESLAIAREIGEKQLQALALNLLATAAPAQRDSAESLSAYEESLALWREVGDRGLRRDRADRPPGWAHEAWRWVDDRVQAAMVLCGLGSLALRHDDYPAAHAFGEEAVSFLREGESGGVLAGALGLLADVALCRSDLAGARALYEESLAISREIGGQAQIGGTLRALGFVALHEGDLETARTLIEEGLAISRDAGRPMIVGTCFNDLADVARRQHQYDRARDRYAEGLAIHRRIGHRWGIAASLLGLGSLAKAAGDVTGAARLFAAAETLREAIGVSMLPIVRAEYEQMLTTLRRATPAQAFAAAWAHGCAMSLDEAIACALDRAEREHQLRARSGAAELSPRSSVLSPRYPDGLSPREVEVLQLIAAGRSNNAIAAELVLSVRTVGRHITTLYGKIGARSRVDATNYALQHNLIDPPRR